MVRCRSLCCMQAIPALIRQLGSGSRRTQQNAALAALATEASSGSSSEIAAAIAAHPGAIPALVGLLDSSGSQQVQCNAVHVLASIAGDSGGAEIRAAVAAQPRAVPALVGLLGGSSEGQVLTTGHPSCVGNAAWVLTVLAEDSGNVRAAIAAQPGAISTLIKLLGSRAEAMQIAAAGVLYRLVSGSIGLSRSIHAAIAAQPSAVPVLMRLLGSSNEEVLIFAASTLAFLADTTFLASHAIVSAIAAQPSAIPALVGLLGSGGKRVQASAASVLTGIAEGSSVELRQAAIASHPSAIPALVPLLSSCEEISRCNAACALAALADGSSSIQAAIAAQPGAVPALVAMLLSTTYSSTVNQQASAAHALWLQRRHLGGSRRPAGRSPCAAVAAASDRRQRARGRAAQLSRPAGQPCAPDDDGRSGGGGEVQQPLRQRCRVQATGVRRQRGQRGRRCMRCVRLAPSRQPAQAHAVQGLQGAEVLQRRLPEAPLAAAQARLQGGSSSTRMHPQPPDTPHSGCLEALRPISLAGRSCACVYGPIKRWPMTVTSLLLGGSARRLSSWRHRHFVWPEWTSVRSTSELPAALPSARRSAAAASLQVPSLVSCACLEPPALLAAVHLVRLRRLQRLWLQLGRAGAAGSVGLLVAGRGLCRQLVELVLVLVGGLLGEECGGR
jgi:HEAT repeat protein